jgi:hypothetical protein
MDTISVLVDKYKGNPYMCDKLATYIANLPSLMTSIEENYIQRNIQLVDLTDKKDKYVQQFITQHLIFYIPQTELFIEYADTNYSIISEDDIIHYVLTDLNDNELKIWKFKIKKHIIKRIKEMVFSSSIPEPTTIKDVIQNLTMFDSKHHVKYFLTILGDALLNKKDTITYFIDSSYKLFLRKMIEQIYVFTNKSISDVFKYKYYDHKYDQCRILTGKCPEMVPLKHKILNIISVATYLSNKYGNAEGFLSQCNDPVFISATTFLKVNTQETIVNIFIDECMKKTGTTSYKEFYFLWRSYLKQKNLPLIISDIHLKNILIQLNLCKDDVVFLTSTQVFIQTIKVFLDKNNMLDVSEIVCSYNNEHEFKITEEMVINIMNYLIDP